MTDNKRTNCSSTLGRGSEIHPPLGRNGHALGREPHRQPRSMRSSSSRSVPCPPTKSPTTLSVARSNVSTSLRELQGWRIVRVAPVLGDRRQHFESMKDIWEMFRVIFDERKKREIDPTIRVLHECVE